MGKQIEGLRDYYRVDGKVFIVDHVVRWVDAPSSVDEKNYPDQVKEVIKNKYKIQLTVE